MRNYSQLRAMLAISKGSLKAIFRSPSAVIFGFAFPMIFILVFGFIGNGGSMSFKIGFDPTSDTANPVYQAIKTIPAIKVEKRDMPKLMKALQRDSIIAILNIQKNINSPISYTINLKSSTAVNPQNLSIFQQNILTGIISQLNQRIYPQAPTIAVINPDIQKIPGRIYRRIDFILPGQLGFSLLSSAIFGVAFMFFNLRQQLVLKRFYATPIRRPYIVLGEALSRVLFQMLTSVIIVSAGYFIFHFTLVNGFRTFFDIMLLSFFSLIVFMGFGFIVSGVAKNDSTIPPFANLIAMPQFLLAGTFFPIEVFPSWLQPLCRALPLTQFNNAMRKIAFEGDTLLSCWKEFGILAIWGIAVYAVATRVFKWE